MLDHVERHHSELGYIVSWEDDGESFTVHDSEAFVERIMPQ